MAPTIIEQVFDKAVDTKGCSWWIGHDEQALLLGHLLPDPWPMRRTNAIAIVPDESLSAWPKPRCGLSAAR